MQVSTSLRIAQNSAVRDAVAISGNATAAQEENIVKDLSALTFTIGAATEYELHDPYSEGHKAIKLLVHMAAAPGPAGAMARGSLYQAYEEMSLKGNLVGCNALRNAALHRCEETIFKADENLSIVVAFLGGHAPSPPWGTNGPGKIDLINTFILRKLPPSPDRTDDIFEDNWEPAPSDLHAACAQFANLDVQPDPIPLAGSDTHSGQTIDQWLDSNAARQDPSQPMVFLSSRRARSGQVAALAEPKPSGFQLHVLAAQGDPADEHDAAQALKAALDASSSSVAPAILHVIPPSASAGPGLQIYMALDAVNVNAGGPRGTGAVLQKHIAQASEASPEVQEATALIHCARVLEAAQAGASPIHATATSAGEQMGAYDPAIPPIVVSLNFHEPLPPLPLPILAMDKPPPLPTSAAPIITKAARPSVKVVPAAPQRDVSAVFKEALTRLNSGDIPPFGSPGYDCFKAVRHFQSQVQNNKEAMPKPRAFFGKESPSYSALQAVTNTQAIESLASAPLALLQCADNDKLASAADIFITHHEQAMLNIENAIKLLGGDDKQRPLVRALTALRDDCLNAPLYKAVLAFATEVKASPGTAPELRSKLEMAVFGQPKKPVVANPALTIPRASPSTVLRLDKATALATLESKGKALGLSVVESNGSSQFDSIFGKMHQTRQDQAQAKAANGDVRRAATWRLRNAPLIDASKPAWKLNNAINACERSSPAYATTLVNASGVDAVQKVTSREFGDELAALPKEFLEACHATAMKEKTSSVEPGVRIKWLQEIATLALEKRNESIAAIDDAITALRNNAIKKDHPDVIQLIAELSKVRSECVEGEAFKNVLELAQTVIASPDAAAGYFQSIGQ